MRLTCAALAAIALIAGVVPAAAAQGTVGEPSDPFMYARVGYGLLFGDQSYQTPALGVGYRAELDAIAVDLSLNVQQIAPGAGGAHAGAASLVRVAALRFVDPDATRSAYWGGGLSLGMSGYGSDGKSWGGSGLQGEVTAGYEVARRSTIRLFVEATGVLPFYRITRTGALRGVNTHTTHESRYAPFASLSVGVGF